MAIKEKVLRLSAKAGMKLKEYAPDIFFYSGCVLLLGGTVMACKQTLRLEGIIDYHQSVHEDIDDYELDEKTRKKEHFKNNADMVLDIAKLYAPAVGIAGIGYFCVGKAHYTLKKDKKELLATVATIDNAYRRYRERVRDKMGDQEENDIYTGREPVEVTEMKPGEDKPVKKVFRHQVYDPNDVTAICFSREMCEGAWKGDPILDRITLQNIIIWAQNRYDSYGYIHMKDIYDLFTFYPEPGEAQCRMASEYGYIKGHGADKIDIGLDDPSNIEMQRFLNGETDSVWIHFNDCGPINKYL